MRRSQAPSSFNGIIDEIPEVSVDNFQKTNCRAYFLSHCHTDHTSGLFSDALFEHLKKNSVYVYMSEPSAAIIKHESGVSCDIVDFIKPLAIGTTTITVASGNITETGDYYLSVSLIPAGHCFGSVMFLFRTLYKTILYTGDFRISPNGVSKYAQLHENGSVVEIDALYIDTTFQNDTHVDFPTRSECVEVIIQYLKKWLEANDSNLAALHTSAKYGYEYVFNQIYKQLGEKVYVGDDIWKLYSQFPKTLTGVTHDITNSRIHLCRNRTETKSHESCPSQRLNPQSSFLYVHFSAYKWTGYLTEEAVVQTKQCSDNYRIDVCFATHCSKSELDYFIDYLSPRKVVGFPNDYIRNHMKTLASNKRKYYESEQNESPQKMCNYVDKKVLREIFYD